MPASATALTSNSWWAAVNALITVSILIATGGLAEPHIGVGGAQGLPQQRRLRRRDRQRLGRRPFGQAQIEFSLASSQSLRSRGLEQRRSRLRRAPNPGARSCANPSATTTRPAPPSPPRTSSRCAHRPPRHPTIPRLVHTSAPEGQETSRT